MARRPHHSSFVLLGALCSAVIYPGALLSQTSETQALEAVREEVESLQRRLSRQHAQRDEGLQALKAVELELANASRALSVLRGELAAQRSRREALTRESAAANERLKAERTRLAEQVRMSYLNGRQEVLRLLLNQQSPARLGRMVVYYDYVNRVRAARLEAVSREIGTLAELAQATEQVARELEMLEQSQVAALGRLDRSRTQRLGIVTGLEAEIAASGNEIQRLKDEEARLAQLVAELETVLAGFPVDSQEAFSRIKGDLAWPVPGGTLISDYGQTRAGEQLRWNGVVVAAPGGTPVRAVYHGRVAYADWLPGMGLLVIVDHGDGYMSLYGHNEAVLKESGDWVTPGEVIAHVGDSGGQPQAALYFEIRHDGEPVNPHPWMGQRLSR